jgi:hypothetical protein
MTSKYVLAAVGTLATFGAGAYALDAAQTRLAQRYYAAAPGDAARGRTFFHASHVNAKGETRSCTSCHTNALTGPGKSAAGKEIGPMAASVAPKRFTDPAEVEKWFKRNCSDVLGRECTAQEKSDVLAFLLSI